MKNNRIKACYALLGALLLILIFMNILTGSSSMTIGDALRILFSHDTVSKYGKIIWDIRMPRILAAALLGGALSVSGFLLQTFFANPAKNVMTERANGTKCTMWELCMDTKYAPIAQTLAKQSRKDRRERAILIDATTGAQLKEYIGDANGVETGQTFENGAKTATLHTHTRLAAFPSPADIRSSLVAKSAFDYIAIPGQLRRIDRGENTIGEDDKKAIEDFEEANAKGQLNKQAWKKFVLGLVSKGIIKMVRVV